MSSSGWRRPPARRPTASSSCHGWLYDEADARQEAGRFFALLDAVLAPLGERITPVRMGLHWPSKPFADGDVARRAGGSEGHHGLWPQLEARLTGSTRTARVDLTALLLDLGQAEIPASPEEELELDLLLRGLIGGTGIRGGLPLSPFQALSFWVMKRRAGEVGERFGRERLAPLWGALPRPPRLHLIGHSFGAKLVTSIVLGGARPTSLTLLLAAFSAFAFAPEVPGCDGPGFYHRVLVERSVQGRIVVLRSEHDTALATFYPTLAGAAEAGRGREATPQLGRQVRTTSVVATSALGAVGARGVGAPELDLAAAQQMGLPAYPIVNVDGSRIVRAGEPFVGAHRDIHHAEIATLVAMAAGLLAGGPDGARPRPVDPRVGP